MKRHAWLVLAVGCLMAADNKDDEVKKEQKKLTGTWSVTAFVSDGNKLPEEELKKFKLVLDGPKYTLKQDDNVVSTGTVKLDPTKKPKTLDISPSEGDGQGQTWVGIYELDGDNYKVCYTPTGKDRPTKFESESGSGFFLLTFKRNKP